MDEGDAVLLGIPAKDVRVDETCPYTAKLGGIPAWFNAANSIPDSQLHCPQCHNSLYLVAQIYAPVTTPRSLYIFGCNSAKCVTVPNSWRVFRFQVDDTEQSKPAAPESTTTHCVAPNSSTWGRGDSDDDSDDDNWSSIGGSTWGSNVTTATCDIDLEALLNARDNAIAQSTKRMQPQQPSATKAEVPSTVAGEVDEPIATRPHFASIFLNVDDEPAVSGTEKFTHETQLLNAYLADEEKENASEVARLRNILKNKPSDSPTTSDGGVGDHAESYERTPLRDKLFLRFQKRVKRSPSQCLRYNYGGEPLWPSPPPANLVVPNCQCGEARVFELQVRTPVRSSLSVPHCVVAHASYQLLFESRKLR
ncbi:hypothetical protein, variant [Aphanomyces invadans]|uniref:Programmed cell death protein 2 C-terminal domain-containing protein n=1 Tax=Aphanomyces invadans TaxID=157072 RepID=A0A024URT3_9STRA|nr:hypothetical protein, variant [Aphanomyces invadans]ETW08989.1 hypothetical protein, variant [Aphanomyces invadans]|eukprot:XP_008862794.1 hypothetical protein, variant [Aphanomyces invadans]